MKQNEVGAHQWNNFDFLRIVAAFLVLISHQMPLSGRTEWVIPGFSSGGGLGLMIFFVMSGYLVCESWSRDPNVVRFAIRRLLRIWPGLAVAVVVTTCILGPVVTTRDLGAYFSDPAFKHYFAVLRFTDVEHLPAVFESNPNQGVNGSLWTLPIEVRWYEYLALAGLLGVVRWRILLLLITLGIAIHYFWIFDVELAMAEGIKRGWKEELGLYFLAGACLQRYKTSWLSRRWAVLAMTVVTAVAFLALDKHHAAYWLVICVGTLVTAVSAWGPLTRVARFGDFSYGVYIYAFPVQQTIVFATGNRLSLAAGVAASAACTLACAVVSWHLIEAPALRLKPSRSSRVGAWPALTPLFARLRSRDGMTRRAQNGSALDGAPGNESNGEVQAGVNRAPRPAARCGLPLPAAARENVAASRARTSDSPDR